MTVFLCCLFLIVGYLGRSWRIEHHKTRADRAETVATRRVAAATVRVARAWQVADNVLADLAAETRAHAVTKERLAIADLVNDTLVDDLRVAWGQPADDDIDQAIELANSPRHGAILDLIAGNEAARFDADDVDWGQR